MKKALIFFLMAVCFMAIANSADYPPPGGDFVLVKGGSFMMGSPESEDWRGADEAQHRVQVSDFYLSRYEVTQKLWSEVMGSNPSSIKGDDGALPVENISWLEAIEFCNALSRRDGLAPAYTILDGGAVVRWDRSANGYRLPTEAEWEYACRAGSTGPFYTQKIPGADDVNFYGHYPYQIEQNYFTQEHLETKPGVYRARTLSPGSFAPNPLGLYDMYGNVSEWCWDFYGAYGASADNPAGPAEGTRRVYRGGGWNDFGKNLRSAYRAALPQGNRSISTGLRLAANANDNVKGVFESREVSSPQADTGRGLIVYFSWGGNTRGIAREIQRQTGFDIVELVMREPYSTNYNTVLNEAQRDQRAQARPALRTQIQNFDSYSTVLIGYPNWWASIPMPIATFLESYDFSGKTIMPFCSHGGGRLGQSVTAISKLAPAARITEGLSIHYSGGRTLNSDIREWLSANGVSGL